MEKADFLNFRALVLELRQIRALIDDLERERFTLPGCRITDTPREAPARGSAIERGMIRREDVMDLYLRRRLKLEDEIRAVEEAIASLEVPLERLLMRLRYIEGRGWGSIVDELRPLGYSERQVYRMHGYALQKLKEV